MSTVAERVAKGAAFLDEHDPGWWRTDNGRPIDLDTLDLGSDSQCVLGQRCPLEVLRNYERARWGFAESDPDERYAAYVTALSGLSGLVLNEWAEERGFFLLAARNDQDEWSRLTAEWKRVIGARRHVMNRAPKYAAAAAAGTILAAAACPVTGPAAGPALWWLLQQPAWVPVSLLSVLSMAALVTGVLVLTSATEREQAPKPPSARAALLRRAWQAARDGRLTASLRERLGAAQEGEVFVPAQDDLDFAEAMRFAGRGLRF